jgi:hypothetical protein
MPFHYLCRSERAIQSERYLPAIHLCASTGPAEESELVRTLAMLEQQRRQFVRDRTQAIQRLGADWTQHDPVSEARVIHCDRQREIAKLNACSSAPRLPSALRPVASSWSSQETSRTSTSASPELGREIAQLLLEHDNPLADLHGAGANLAARSLLRPVMSAASATPAHSLASAALRPYLRLPARRPTDTAYTTAATDNSTQRATIVIVHNATRRKPGPTSHARSRRQDPAEPADPSSATSPTFSTAASPPGPKNRPQQ